MMTKIGAFLTVCMSFTDIRLLLDLLKERDALSGQFLRHHAEVLRLNDEHADLQKQVLARQAENRTLMAEIKSMEGDNKPDEHGLSQGQAEQLSMWVSMGIL